MLQIRAFVALAALCAAGVASAQQPPAEEPGWAKGRPKTDTAMKMAPVPAFPIPTRGRPAADQEVQAAARLQGRDLGLGRARRARAARRAPRATIFVSTLFVANKVYAFPSRASARPR